MGSEAASSNRLTQADRSALSERRTLEAAVELMGERGWVPAWLGLWTANGLALGAALFLMRLAPRGDS